MAEYNNNYRKNNYRYNKNRSYNNYNNNYRSYKKKRSTVDAFYNPSGSGFGGNYDPIKRMTYNLGTLVDRSTAESLYRTDWVSRKIIECIPDDSMRKFIDLNAPDESIVRDVNEKLKRIKTVRKFKECMYNARLYGGSVIVMGIVDGLNIENPVDFNKIESIEHLNVIDRWSLDVASLYKNPLKEKYGEPEYYRLNPSYHTKEDLYNRKIHESRVLRFDGEYLTQYLKTQNNNWHDTVFNKVDLALKQFGTSLQSGAVLFQDFIAKILKLPDLEEYLTSDEGRQKLDLRIQYAIANLSSLGIVLLGENEEYNKVQTPIAGLAELMNIYIEQMSACSDIPRSRFFGQSLGTLAGATETTRAYYDIVSSYQIDNIEEPLKYLIKIILNSKSCKTNGQEPDEWDFKFNSLWDETNKEVTTARKMQAQVDDMAIEKKILTPKEVRKNRYRPDGYSFDTHVDPDNYDGELYEEKTELTTEGLADPKNNEEQFENNNMENNMRPEK